MSCLHILISAISLVYKIFCFVFCEEKSMLCWLEKVALEVSRSGKDLAIHRWTRWRDLMYSLYWIQLRQWATFSQTLKALKTDGKVEKGWTTIPRLIQPFSEIQRNIKYDNEIDTCSKLKTQDSVALKMKKSTGKECKLGILKICYW